MNYAHSDSQITGFTPNVAADDPAYKSAVAEPTMKAIDAMPPRFRELVYEFGYIDVYRAWKRGWTVDRIRARARNGVFTLA